MCSRGTYPKDVKTGTLSSNKYGECKYDVAKDSCFHFGYMQEKTLEEDEEEDKYTQNILTLD